MENTENSFENNQQATQATPPAEKKRKAPKLSLSYKNKKLLRRAFFGVLFVALAFVVVKAAVSSSQNVRSQEAGGSPGGAVASATINQSYPFAARNDKGALVDKKQVKMTVVQAELNKKIIIKGQPATAREGKAFLILTLEVENTDTQKLYLPVNELVRLQDGDKMRAPDVHNNLVLAEPIATKTTRIGFLINEDSRVYTLKVGEVNGAKQTINLKF